MPAFHLIREHGPMQMVTAVPLPTEPLTLFTYMTPFLSP